MTNTFEAQIVDMSSMRMHSTPPPPGIYVPAVLFFDEEEELDVPSINAHVIRLAEVSLTLNISYL